LSDADKNYFKSRGVTATDLEEAVRNLDESEAVRLADYEQLSRHLQRGGANLCWLATWTRGS
jgi:predicted DNA-binding protein (UPF0251 family)